MVFKPMENELPSILDKVRALYPFPYSITGEGNDRAIAAFQAELDFKVHEFESGADQNGWVIPPAWTVEKAELRRDGKLVYDGLSSPLGVITQSQSFAGTISLDDLKKHLFFSDEDPDAIVYHWTGLYRPNDNNWGFCLPRHLFEALEYGAYEVDLVTTKIPATMKVLDFNLPGNSDQTILLNAHNCHPFQANDDISGCAVAIEIMKRLSRLPERRYSYRLIIAPELVGPAFWLESLGAAAKNLALAIMVKSVGNDADLRLQESYTGKSIIDTAAHYVFQRRYGDYDFGAFRTVYGNDETVFEAPGYEIPSISLTRFPFQGYHTDKDTPDTLSEARLLDTADCLFDILLTLERNVHLKCVAEGLVCLSHPRYDLYRRAPAPGIDKAGYSDELRRWNLLMNSFPRDINGDTGLLEIARRYDLPLDDLHEYALKWVDKGLARIVEGRESQ